jgi:FkbM family methyltransferase
MTKFGEKIEDLIVAGLGKRVMKSVNEFLLSTSLRARGFNNYRNSVQSGEHYFIKESLAKINPKLCVDVGANVGDYTKSLLKFTRSKVIAFEPLLEPFAELSVLMLEYPKRLEVVNKGVGAKTGFAEIHFTEGESAHASFAAEVSQVAYVSNEKTRKVEIVTLDSYFKKAGLSEVDFIKIDTEGYETEVLLGAKNTIANCRPKIVQIEYNWHQLFRNSSLLVLSKMLPEYSVFQLQSDRIERRDPNDPLSNIFYFSNFVFVRNDLVAAMGF